MTQKNKVDLDEIPTPEDVIGWLQEEAFNNGMIKYSAVFQPERITELTYLDLESGPTEPCRQSIVVDVMKTRHAEWEHEQRIHKKIKEHSDVVKKAETILEQRLLAAGMSEKDLGHLKSKRGSARLKVAELYKLQHLPVEGPRRVKAQLLRQTETGTDLRDAYLSADDTLDDLKPVLNSLSATMSSRGEHIPNKGTGPWMYQLVEIGSRRLSKTTAGQYPKVPLLVDADYRDMIREISRKGTKTPSATLYQVTFVLCKSNACLYTEQESTMLFQKSLATKGEETDAGDDLLDEAGVPYFQEIDWAKLIEKEFGNHRKAAKWQTTRLQTDEAPRRSSRLSSVAAKKD
ncbi:hypothetical protein MMC27_008709 [Xylographa pallens]|nr:hypothetical protein [Xylographa pallens]